MSAILGDAPRKARRGRPPGSAPDSKTERVEIRMTAAQEERYQALGGAQWVRDQIDKAKG